MWGSNFITEYLRGGYLPGLFRPFFKAYGQIITGQISPGQINLGYHFLVKIWLYFKWLTCDSLFRWHDWMNAIANKTSEMSCGQYSRPPNTAPPFTASAPPQYRRPFSSPKRKVYVMEKVNIQVFQVFLESSQKYLYSSAFIYLVALLNLILCLWNTAYSNEESREGCQSEDPEQTVQKVNIMEYVISPVSPVGFDYRIWTVNGLYSPWLREWTFYLRIPSQTSRISAQKTRQIWSLIGFYCS